MVTQNLRKLGLLCAWIIERLDRKLADLIGSNIGEKCGVILEPSNLLHPMFCASIFPRIFLYLYLRQIAHVLKYKDEEDLLLEKTVKTVQNW